MEGRIKTLFNKVGLEKEIDSIIQPKLFPEPYDVSAVQECLYYEKKKSMQFLMNAMGVK